MPTRIAALRDTAASPIRRQLQAWRAKQAAKTAFAGYLRQHPAVKEIYDEELERETVHVARGQKWLGLGIAATNYSLAITGNPVNFAIGTANLLAARLAWVNERSKKQKARGNTLARALKLAKEHPELHLEREVVDSWISGGLLRRGDLGRY